MAVCYRLSTCITTLLFSWFTSVWLRQNTANGLPCIHRIRHARTYICVSIHLMLLSDWHIHYHSSVMRLYSHLWTNHIKHSRTDILHKYICIHCALRDFNETLYDYFKLNLIFDEWGISNKIALGWFSVNLTSIDSDNALELSGTKPLPVPV